MGVAGSAVLVVERFGSGAVGEGGEGPEVAGVGEAAVAGVAGENDVANELAAHLENRPDDPDALVFTSPEGSTLNHKNFYRRHFKPTVTTADLPTEMRFHDLRHTCAALCIALGAHPKAIQERLGHSSITVTLDRYGHLFPKLDETLTTRLDDLHRAAIGWP